MKKIKIALNVVCILLAVSLFPTCKIDYSLLYNDMYREGELHDCFVRIDNVGFLEVDNVQGHTDRYIKVEISCVNYLDEDIWARDLFSVRLDYGETRPGIIGGHGIRDVGHGEIEANSEFEYSVHFVMDGIVYNEVFEVIVSDGRFNRVLLNVLFKTEWNESNRTETWSLIMLDE